MIQKLENLNSVTVKSIKHFISMQYIVYQRKEILMLNYYSFFSCDDCRTNSQLIVKIVSCFLVGSLKLTNIYILIGHKNRVATDLTNSQDFINYD